MRTRWLPCGGVQAGVVALRLGVGDLVDGDEADDAAELDRDLVTRAVVDGRGPVPHLFGDPADGFGQALTADRFEDVVDGLEVEGVDGEALVRGDEDDQRGRGESGEELGDVETGETGHVDVEEDHVDRGRVVGARVHRAADAAQCLGRTGGALGAADTGVGAQEVEEFLQGGLFVVDGEYAQHEAGV